MRAPLSTGGSRAATRLGVGQWLRDRSTTTQEKITRRLVRPRVEQTRPLLGRLRDQLERWRFRRKVRFWKASGIRFGRGVLVMPTAQLDTTFGWMISIGDRTRIGAEARILVHDATAQRDLSYGRVGPVTIGRDCFVAERVTILPGVTIGDRSMIGVGSVVATDIPPNSRAVGVPARCYGSFDGYLEETRRAIDAGPCWGYRALYGLSEEEREEVLATLRAAGNRGFHYDPYSDSLFYVT